MAMKKTVVGMAFLVVFCLIQVSLAHAIEAGVDVGTAYYRWWEFTTLGVIKEAGNIRTVGGHIAGVPLQKLPALKLRGNVLLFHGQVDYDTKTSLGTPVKTTSNYLGFKVEGNTGWCFVYEQTCIEPFLGLAYRIWERDIDSTSIVQGYPELYSALYGKIGMRVDHKPQEGITIYTAWSIDPMLWARERIDWTSISGETLVVNNGRRVGWTIEGGAHWNYFEALAYWQATRLGKSNEVSCSGIICFQPKSFQDVIGFKVGYLF